MPVIKPFKGIVYNQHKIQKLSSVVAPPYDIIPKEMQENLYRAHPYNVVRLILGRTYDSDNAQENRYTRAKAFFESWLKDRTMVRDEIETFYIYSQLYTVGKERFKRVGFVGLMELETKSGKTALPHENTLLAPKMDRLNLMRSVQANLSPIFVLYEDKKHAIGNIFKKFCAKHSPFIDVTFEKVRNKVWRLDDPHLIYALQSSMSPKKLFIADGHHRYETAVNYSHEVQRMDVPQALKDNSKFLMTYFVPFDEKTLTVLPAHRLIKDIGNLTPEAIIQKLTPYFTVKAVKTREGLLKSLEALKNTHSFGVYLGKNLQYIITLNSTAASDRAMRKGSRDWKNLDVSILHLFILKHVLSIRDDDDNVEFLKDAEKTFRLVDKGVYPLVFFLNPTKATQVKRVAQRGERMPRKATYFYPKPLSGLTINKLS